MTRRVATLLILLAAALTVPACGQQTVQAKTYAGEPGVVLDARPSSSVAVELLRVPVDGQTVRVRASVYADVDPLAPIPDTNGTLLALSVVCPDGSSSPAAENLIKGESPRREQPYAICNGYAGDVRLLARATTGTGRAWSEDPAMRVIVTGSAINVLDAGYGAAEGRPDSPSVLVPPGGAIDLAQVTTAGPGRWVAQAKVTSCTAPSGSGDPGGEDLCPGNVGPGPVVVRVIVQRRCDQGTPATVTLVDTTLTVSAARHHGMWYGSGTMPAPCPTGPARLKVALKHVSGPAFVAHRYNASAIAQFWGDHDRQPDAAPDPDLRVGRA